MKHLEFILNGTFALLMHNPAQMGTVGEKGLGRKRIPKREDEAAAGLYKMANGDFYVPAIAVRNAMLTGSKGSTIGKRAAMPIVAAAVILDEEEFALTDEADKPIRRYGIDTRRAVVQKQGIMRSRPRIDLPWRVHGRFLFDDNVVDSARPVEDALRNAGLTVGLLDYRPEKKGWFGRFEVVSVTLVD